MGNALRKEDMEVRYTYADYKDWELKMGERYELIYGEAYAMAGPSTFHQLIQMELSKQIAVYLTGKPCKVIPAPYDVRLFYAEDESDDTVVQPDISIVCDKKKLGPEGCRGAPDMVIEVLSPGNSAIEMEEKYNLYKDAGVKEYWLVNPKTKTLKTHFFADEGVHIRTYAVTDKADVGIFPGFAIDLEPVFAEDV